MPWQLHALRGQLEHDGEGNLIRRRSLVSVARQNGKTTALKALIGWALTEEPKRRGHPILVISTAHNLSLAAHVFEILAPLLRDEWGARLRWSFGRMDALMPDRLVPVREGGGLSVSVLPEEEFLEFTGLDPDGGGKILRGVELRPVALVAEAADEGLQFRKSLPGVRLEHAVILRSAWA